MSSHDPFPELEGFMADEDVDLRKKALNYLMYPMYLFLPKGSGRRPTHDWIKRFLDMHPDGPRLVAAWDYNVPVEGSFVMPLENEWNAARIWVDTDTGRISCHMIWRDWKMTSFEYAFTRHLMALRTSEASSQPARLIRFRAEIARLPAAQAWF